MSKNVMLSRLTKKQARSWLIENDPEGNPHWKKKNSKKFYIDNIKLNLKDFGIRNQSGRIFINSSNDSYHERDIYLERHY